QGVFSIFFYTKKMLVKFTNIKKYRADLLDRPLFFYSSDCYLKETLPRLLFSQGEMCYNKGNVCVQKKED
ncbi:hypothetical protein SJ898_09415, partial [Enterococcus faecium]